ncbi:hypothetical protein D8674_021921 [Pyrus ussuriensis x Pyrus communis]|uniref:Uncharacterized protein n=1 Tax=Pyrus ussuriensis x Pyrus communis TaxID=2448454 RepID=A0A5N5GKJ2_9ROSA|nr:hypothetical protein D8674_021921 [Pyrus ussuriensis x Pyrus communis]
MDATEIDRVINDVVNFHIEEAVQNEASKAPSTSIEESIPQVQEEAMQQVALTKTTAKLVPQSPVHPQGQEPNAESVPQLPVHLKESAIKTMKQQTFYE